MTRKELLVKVFRLLEAEKKRLQEITDAVRVPALQCAKEAARIAEALAIPATQMREAVRQTQAVAEAAARQINELSTLRTPISLWEQMNFSPPVVRLSEPILRVEIVGWDVPEPDMPDDFDPEPPMRRIGFY